MIEELASVSYVVASENESENEPWSETFREVFKLESMAYLLWNLRVTPIFTNKQTNHLFLDLIHEEYFSAFKRNGYNFEQRSGISELLNDRYLEYDKILDGRNIPAIGSSFSRHLSDGSGEDLDLENALLVVELLEKETELLGRFRKDFTELGVNNS